jgi:hypothetical protein
MVHFLGFVGALAGKGILPSSMVCMLGSIWNEYDALVCRHRERCPFGDRCRDSLTCIYAADKLPVLPGWEPANVQLAESIEAVYGIPRIKHTSID